MRLKFGLLEGVAALAAGTIALSAAPVLEESFGGKSAGSAFYLAPGAARLSEKSLLVEVAPDKVSRGITGAFGKLDTAALAGSRVRCRVETAGKEIAEPGNPWNGGKFMLEYSSGGKHFYPQGKMRTGSYDWMPVEFMVSLPFDLDSANIALGLQDTSGQIRFRNLSVGVVDSFLDFRKAANMGYADPTPGDGKGGWSDQGPENDAANLDRKQELFANVPFRLLEPDANGGKTVLTMRSARFPNGPERVVLPAGERRLEGRNLYLLHTLCWAAPGEVGRLVVTGENGRKQSFEIRSGRDVGDWWSPKPLENGAVGATWLNSSNRVGAYVSRFQLPEKFGPVKEVVLESAGSGSIWIVLAATLSDSVYEPPRAKQVRITADEVWRPFRYRNERGIIAGSALDRSGFLPFHKVGELGRVIVNAAGQLAFEKEPDRPARFLSSCEGTDAFIGRADVAGPQLDTHEKIAAYTQRLRRAGYNMTRTHFLDAVLVLRSEKAFEFSPENLDHFDYLIYCMKENGIYLNFDAMSSWRGYLPGSPWRPEHSRKSYFKLSMHYDPVAREHWRRGIQELLCRVNPYTGTRLIDDPVLAMVQGFNEQEFAFIWPDDWTGLTPRWREFLRSRYPSIEKLNAAHGSNYSSFDAVPIFTPESVQARNVLGRDVNEFLTAVEGDTFRWYSKTLRELGYRGIISNYNMGRSRRYSLLRSEMDAVTMNGYHAHPTSYMQPGSTISQESSLSNAGGQFRGFASTRLAGKPIVVTEHAHTFWNRYRYEQAFVTGAYAAFQNFDGLTQFAQPQSVVPVERINPFLSMSDPVQQASEFLTFFLFRRGDVKPADRGVRVRFNADEMFRRFEFGDSVSATQSRLALVTGFSTDVVASGREPFPARPGEAVLAGDGGSAVVSHAEGYALISDTASGNFKLGPALEELKRQGLLPAENRTDVANELFENATGELFLDVRKRLLSVNTPRLQGVCAEAGTQYRLPDFEVREMSRRGNLSAVSIDGDRPLRDAERIAVVYATDALNSNMVFDDADLRTLRNIGGSPVLLRTGSFAFVLRNRNAGSLRLWALTPEGERTEEIAPVRRSGDTVEFRVDTAKLKEPTVFFELARK